MLPFRAGDVMMGDITLLMIFADFDLSPLTLWINCSFLVLIKRHRPDTQKRAHD